MQPAGQDFSEAYSPLADDQIAELYAQRHTLTEAAREELAAEISRRGIDNARLTGLEESRSRQEATFDHPEKKRRRLLIAALAFYAVALIFARISRHH